MKGKTNATAFLRTFWLVTIIVITGVGIINAIVDPFEIFGFVRKPGFNELKPVIARHSRMIKALHIRNVKPHGIILGSSRAEIGLDPNHPGWNKNSHPVYNLSLTSARIDEVQDYLVHAHANSNINELVLSLDFFMFNENWRHEADFDKDRLSRHGFFLYDTKWIKDLLIVLFSFDGLEASYKTIISQNNPLTTSYYANGMRDTRRKWAEIQSRGGHRSVFLANTKYELTHADGWPLFALKNNQDPNSTLNVFNSIVKFCQHHNIVLHVIISPIHAFKQEIIWEVGFGTEYENWKRAIVGILDRYGIDLWDFSGYNSITTEPFPPLNDTTTQMRNYWEGSHYRKHIGDLILDRIFSFHNLERTIPDDFGVRLNSINIDTYLSNSREYRKQYLNSNHRDINEITHLVHTTNSIRRTIATTTLPRTYVNR